MLINLTPVIGVGKITCDNADDVWKRIAMWQAVFGSFLTYVQTDDPVFLTKSDIDRHIGLETEARDIPFSEFCEDIRDRPLDADPKELPAQVANEGRSLLEICGK